MTLIVYTARIGYRGPDAFDVTRKTATGHGLAFAPSWKILGPVLKSRRENGPGGAFVGWEQYVLDYTAEMRASYRGSYQAWAWLLEQPERTLLCYCNDPAHCHRTILAGILGKLGADVRGERATPTAPDRRRGPAEP